MAQELALAEVKYREPLLHPQVSRLRHMERAALYVLQRLDIIHIFIYVYMYEIAIYNIK